MSEEKIKAVIAAERNRIALRDQFAMAAPITLDQVLQVYGDNDADLQGEHTRAAVYALWTTLRYEYADAMMAEREKNMYTSRGPDGVEEEHGWIEWSGGNCPVGQNDYVEIEIRGGQILHGPAGDFLWEHPLEEWNAIVRYRVERPKP